MDVQTRKTQEQLLKDVRDALDRLFENCDVTPDQMMEDLELIKEDIDSMIGTAGE